MRSEAEVPQGRQERERPTGQAAQRQQRRALLASMRAMRRSLSPLKAVQRTVLLMMQTQVSQQHQQTTLLQLTRLTQQLR
jgi:hypothetical protein